MASPAQRTKMNAASNLRLVQSMCSVSTHSALSTVGLAQKVRSGGHMIGFEYHTDRVQESISLY